MQFGVSPGFEQYTNGITCVVASSTGTAKVQGCIASRVTGVDVNVAYDGPLYFRMSTDSSFGYI